MKLSYALTLLAGGFLSSGYHTMPGEAAIWFFPLGIIALLVGTIVPGDIDR